MTLHTRLLGKGTPMKNSICLCFKKYISRNEWVLCIYLTLACVLKMQLFIWTSNSCFRFPCPWIDFVLGSIFIRHFFANYFYFKLNDQPKDYGGNACIHAFMIPHVKLLKKQQVLMGNAPLCAPSGGLDFQFGTKYTIGKRKSI